MYGVVVHGGNGVQGGHYYSSCKVRPDSQWMMFNDSRVSKAAEAEVAAAAATSIG